MDRNLALGHYAAVLFQGVPTESKGVQTLYDADGQEACSVSVGQPVGNPSTLAYCLGATNPLTSEEVAALYAFRSTHGGRVIDEAGAPVYLSPDGNVQTTDPNSVLLMKDGDGAWRVDYEIVHNAQATTGITCDSGWQVRNWAYPTVMRNNHPDSTIPACGLLPFFGDQAFLSPESLRTDTDLCSDEALFEHVADLTALSYNDLLVGDGDFLMALERTCA